MTDPNRFPKWLLTADLAICSVWLFIVGYIFYNPYLMLFPMLRIWLSFLTYSRRWLAWCPMGLLAIVSVPLLEQFAPIYELWLSPLVKIARSTLSLFGCNRELVTDFLLLLSGQDTLNGWGTHVFIWCIGFAWLVGIPLAIYLHRVAHKGLVPPALSRKQSWMLFGYMLIVITLFGTQFFNTLPLYESIATSIMLVLLIPLLFRCDNARLLTNAQKTYLSLMGVACNRVHCRHRYGGEVHYHDLDDTGCHICSD